MSVAVSIVSIACLMATCGSKFVSGSSRKATMAESVFVG